MKKEIEELIERLEKATGEDREIDVSIHSAIGGVFISAVDNEGAEYKALRYVPHYTSSIDAKLPDEDIVVVSEQKPHPDRPEETKWMALQRGAKIAAYGRTEAIARRIASLRARITHD